jgi:hypothetical protein
MTIALIQGFRLTPGHPHCHKRSGSPKRGCTTAADQWIRIAFGNHDSLDF